MINKAIKALYFYNGVFVFAGGLLGPIYALYVQGINKNVVTISTSWAVFLCSSVVFTYIISRTGDRIQKKKYLLMAGFLLRAIAWTSYIFVDSITFLFVVQIILGIGDALGTPAFGALFAEHLDNNIHIAEYADMQIIFNLCSALAAVLGGIIVAHFGFMYLFMIMAALALISFFGILLKPEELL